MSDVPDATKWVDELRGVEEPPNSTTDVVESVVWGNDAIAFARAVAAKEREACAMVCDDRVMRCEKEAQEAIINGEHDEVSSIRSTAWQISVCAAMIRARGE